MNMHHVATSPYMPEPFEFTTYARNGKLLRPGAGRYTRYILVYPATHCNKQKPESHIPHGGSSEESDVSMGYM